MISLAIRLYLLAPLRFPLLSSAAFTLNFSAYLHFCIALEQQISLSLLSQINSIHADLLCKIDLCGLDLFYTNMVYYELAVLNLGYI